MATISFDLLVHFRLRQDQALTRGKGDRYDRRDGDSEADRPAHLVDNGVDYVLAFKSNQFTRACTLAQRFSPPTPLCAGGRGRDRRSP
jgi:hypothetical protein